MEQLKSWSQTHPSYLFPPPRVVTWWEATKVIYMIVYLSSLSLSLSLTHSLTHTHTHTHTNLYRYFSSAAVIRMQQMLSIDACQSLILSSPTFNLPSCCATNPVSCHFLRSSDCSLKAPSPPDKEEGNRHCLATDTPALAPPSSLRSPKLKGRPALAPP